MDSLRGLLEWPSRRLIFTPLLAFVMALVTVAATSGGAQAALDSEEQAFLTLINSHRQANGLGSLSLDWQLNAAANWMSNDMAANDYYSHTDSLGRDPFQRMADFGYNYRTWKGENLAAGVNVAQAAFDVFKNSPGHNSNMLNPNFKVIGIALAYGAGTTYGWYWTTDFGGQGAEAGDVFGDRLACGDFDGDGFDDLAIGVPGEDIGAVVDAGAVNVFYGSGSGLTAAGDQLWHQDTPGVLGGAEAGDVFGDSLACGDFDGDGFDDLAIGAPGEDIGAVVDAGAVNVFYGSASGLTAAGDQLWHQNVSGVLNGAEAGDLFGSSLASGDYDGDGKDDLAVGAPGEDIGAIADAGAANVFYGSASGLTASGDQLWHQNVPGVLGGAEAGDLFGSSLASGDYDGNGKDDLAVGAPGEDVGAVVDVGALNVLYGSGSGLTASGDQLWHQDSGGIMGAAEAGDLFGSSLASGDYDGDGKDDLAVGAPGEDIGAIADAGAANVLYGSGSGLTASGDQLWHQDSAGIMGGAEAGDLFGSSLASGGRMAGRR